MARRARRVELRQRERARGALSRRGNSRGASRRRSPARCATAALRVRRHASPRAEPSGLTAVIEASHAADSAVVAAWLMEREQRFNIDAKTLVQLADAGVPGAVTDALVAVSNPSVFHVARASAGDRDGDCEPLHRRPPRERRRVSAMGVPYDPWSWGYLGYGYPIGYGYGYGSLGYGRYGSAMATAATAGLRRRLRAPDHRRDRSAGAVARTDGEGARLHADAGRLDRHRVRAAAQHVYATAAPSPSSSGSGSSSSSAQLRSELLERKRADGEAAALSRSPKRAQNREGAPTMSAPLRTRWWRRCGTYARARR